MKRILFIVQGEGRGHMTQALALAEVLRRAGHSVCAACVGTNPRRALPAFFRDGLGASLMLFDEPGFEHGGRGLHAGATLLQAARRLPAFRRALDTLDQAVARYQPDVIVNFFTLMGGLYNALRRPGVPLVCVGHQYLFHHPAYPFPPGRRAARRMARLYARLTALGAARRLALSFYPAPALPSQSDLRVVPPLLRADVRNQTVCDDGFLLVYLLNEGYAEDVRAWSAAHPEVPVHCFRDAPGPPVAPTAALTFHPLCGKRFVEMMARCRALVCTAGFESVCEAMYLQKPVLMVPVEGHFEQQCNAFDAQQAGAGLQRQDFDLGRLLDAAAAYRSVSGFRAWADAAPGVFLREIVGEEAEYPVHASLLHTPGTHQGAVLSV